MNIDRKKDWNHINREKLLNTRIFDVYEDELISPRTGQSLKFNILDYHHSWVNIVAVTPKKELVLVKQYRHGSRTFELETPGGCIELNEDPITAAIRELREETGYSGKSAQIIGTVFPNPAMQGNLCYLVVINDVSKTHDTAMDEGEDLDTVLLPYKHVTEKVASGEIRHGLVLNALYFYELHSNKTEHKNEKRV